MKKVYFSNSSLFVIVFLFFIGLKGLAQNSIHSGEGTYYVGVAGSASGNCSIDVAAGDYLHCALNSIDYDNATACGGYIKVNGQKGSVVLQVVDRCPECKAGDVDMTEAAFAMIDDVVNGRVPITWEYVENPNDTAVKIKFKEGSSQYWTAIQLFDINYPIATLEYLDAEGNWIGIDRALFNFFIAPNGIKSPMQLRATAVNGTVLEFNDISISQEVIVTSQQFSKQVLGREKGLDAQSSVIYPNPTHAKVYINSETPKHWQLLDAQSRVLDKGLSLDVDLSSYTPGIYFLNITADNYTYKLVKD